MSTPPRPGSLASRLGKSDTVLVVEDEPDIATFLGAFFRASGTQVVHCNPENANQVADQAADLGAACLLMDLNLDGLTGFEILEVLRADPRVAAIPVVIVTADSRSVTRERAVGLGAAAFVPKPFNVKDLFATVSALMAGDPLLGDAVEGDAGEATVRRGALRGGVLPSEVLEERLVQAVTVAQRQKESASFALLRALGVGDNRPAVMAELASSLAAALPEGEVLGASAPDELAVLFVNVTSEGAAKLLSAALGDGPLDVNLPAGRRVAVNCAAGLAATPEHATTGDELYMAADVALAEAVESGGGLVTAR